MFNKIKNFFNRSKKAIDNKCNEIYCKAQTAVANAKAELYIDKTVGSIICVVVGTAATIFIATPIAYDLMIRRAAKAGEEK